MAFATPIPPLAPPFLDIGSKEWYARLRGGAVKRHYTPAALEQLAEESNRREMHCALNVLAFHQPARPVAWTRCGILTSVLLLVAAAPQPTEVHIPFPPWGFHLFSAIAAPACGPLLSPQSALQLGHTPGHIGLKPALARRYNVQPSVCKAIEQLATYVQSQARQIKCVTFSLPHQQGWECVTAAVEPVLTCPLARTEAPCSNARQPATRAPTEVALGM